MIASKASWKLVGIWWAIAVLVAGVTGCLNLPLLWPLAMRGQLVEGVTLSKDPNNHRTIKYTYRVHGELFTSSTQGGAGLENPPFDELAVGTPLKVYYNPKNPSAAIPGEPNAHLLNELISVGLASVVIPTCIVIWTYQARRRKVGHLRNE